MHTYKITISGELGSGKSSLSKLLCEKAGFSIISVGAIQRELAAKYGMSTLEFNQYMEAHPELDIECDNKTVEYGKSEANLILDSRMAWHFVPHAFKIHLLVDINTAAERIFNDNVRKNEQNNDMDHTKQNILARKSSEVKRFMEQYGVDINDLNNYDLVVDTTDIAPDKLSDFVLEKFELWKKGEEYNRIWLSPDNILCKGNTYLGNGEDAHDKPKRVYRENGLFYLEKDEDPCIESLFVDLVPVVVRMNQ